jgi:hypothetical protein
VLEVGEVVVKELREMTVVEEVRELTVVKEFREEVVVEELGEVVEELGEVVVDELREAVVEVVEELGEVVVVVEDVDDVLEELVVEEDVVVAHADSARISLSSKVIAAVRANSPPSFVASVWAVIEARATIFPENTVPTPRVAELPTCQNTLHAWAPLVKDTAATVEVMSVEPI